MRLTLCVPGLLLPPQALLDTARDLPLPALATLLGRGRLARLTLESHYDWLADEVRLQTLPAAPLRLMGDGGDPGTAAWICLDPVPLKVHRRGIAVDDPASLDLDADEDAALRAALTPLLAGFGDLTATVPGHWHLRLADVPAPEMPPLPLAIGRDLDPRQPAGDAAAPWRRLIAELQTALHAHPVNRARDAAGRPLVSTLWPWGGGRLAERPVSPWAAVGTRDPVLAGLARHLGAECTLPPARYSGAATDLVVIEDLAAPARALDALAWTDALLRLEADWFAPLADALRAGRLHALRLAGFGGGMAFDLDATRFDLRKFWRRPRALATLPEFAA